MLPIGKKMSERAIIGIDLVQIRDAARRDGGKKYTPATKGGGLAEPIDDEEYDSDAEI
jgi:hypothetical protein